MFRGGRRSPRLSAAIGHPGGPGAAVRDGTADVAILHAPFDQRALDTELLLTEPRVAARSACHPLAARSELHRADLAGEPMPRWAGQSDPASVAYRTGADASSAAQPPGPEINDISQLLDAVRLGGVVAYVPVSLADQHRSTDLAFVPVSDLRPSEVLAARRGRPPWPPAVAARRGRPPWPPAVAASRGRQPWPPSSAPPSRSPLATPPRPPLEPQFE
jgi:DNA-binding transcriptional LysR family regulator